jgi:hypothetical protein
MNTPNERTPPLQVAAHLARPYMNDVTFDRLPAFSEG